VRERVVRGTPGDPDRPLPERALQEKFRRSVEPTHGARWEAMWDMARHPDRIPRASDLFSAFEP
jgi:hypothetical protein